MELILSADPIRALNAGSINFSSHGHADPGKLHKSDSSLKVRDSSGTIVATLTPPFVSPNLEHGGDWMSSGGPRIQQALPPGDYTATWTVDGRDSNVAHFSISPRQPDPLWLEPIACGARPCLALHVFNEGPVEIDIPRLMGESVLMVDGVAHHIVGLSWSGHAGLEHGFGYGWTIRPNEFGVDLTGHHVVSAIFAGHRSNEIEIMRWEGPQMK